MKISKVNDKNEITILITPYNAFSPDFSHTIKISDISKYMVLSRMENKYFINLLSKESPTLDKGIQIDVQEYAELETFIVHYSSQIFQPPFTLQPSTSNNELTIPRIFINPILELQVNE